MSNQEVSPWIKRLDREKLEWYVHALFKEAHEIEHILAFALGYQAGGPDYPGGEGEPIIGDHTPVTLAMEAARKLKEN